MLRRLWAWVDPYRENAPDEIQQRRFPLPLELVDLVLRNLDHDADTDGAKTGAAYRDLAAACLVSRGWYRLARPRLYRRLVLTADDLDFDRPASLIHQLSDINASFVKAIILHCGGESFTRHAGAAFARCINVTDLDAYAQFYVWRPDKHVQLIDIAQRFWPRLQTLRFPDDMHPSLTRLSTLTRLEISSIAFGDDESALALPEFRLERLRVLYIAAEDFKLLTSSSHNTLQVLHLWVLFGTSEVRLDNLYKLSKLAVWVALSRLDEEVLDGLGALLRSAPPSVAALEIGLEDHGLGDRDGTLERSQVTALVARGLPTSITNLSLRRFPPADLSAALFPALLSVAWLPLLQRLDLEYPQGGAPDEELAARTRAARPGVALSWTAAPVVYSVEGAEAHLAARAADA